jgi:hypothetical protein
MTPDQHNEQPYSLDPYLGRIKIRNEDKRPMPPPDDPHELIERIARRLQLWWMTQKHEPMHQDTAADLARAAIDASGLEGLRKRVEELEEECNASLKAAGGYQQAIARLERASSDAHNTMITAADIIVNGEEGRLGYARERLQQSIEEIRSALRNQQP